MKGFLPWLVLLGLGGVALWWLTRKGGPAQAEVEYTPSPTTVTVGEQSWELPTEPGTYVYTWDSEQGKYVLKGDETTSPEPGELEPEYVPPPTYETQAPGADETKRLGTEENPLYTEIPGQLIPHAGSGGWYERRNIEEVLGWTEEEYLEQIAVIRETPPGERTVEQQYAGGYSDTMEQAQRAVDFKTRVKAYGGAYINGVLTPPDTWQGSVTAFAQYVRASLDR